MERTAFRDIGGYPRLFLDYVDDFPRVRRLFSSSPFDDSAWEPLFKNLESRQYARRKLTEILRKQNTAHGDRKLTAPLLEKLEDPRCVVVVSGQQAGLFLGPLYTVYKAQTAIRLAESLERRYGLPVVPLFWMEVNDHDFDEVRRVYLLSPKGELKKFQYVDDNEDKAVPVHDRFLSASISPFLDEIADIYGRTDNARQTLRELRSIYRSGRSFPDVFMRFYRAYFPGQPLLFVNPGDPNIKRLAAPFFETVLVRHPEIKEALLEQSKLLEGMAYETQVSVRISDIHLFHVVNDERVRLTSGALYDKPPGTNREHARKIADFVEQNSESLSADVLLRPLLQDYLFPTAAYVAGPAEIAYFAQLKSLYRLLDIAMPVIFPRWSGTIVDAKTMKFLNSAAVSPRDFIEDDGTEIIQKIVKSTAGKKYDTLIHGTYSELHSRLDELRKQSAGLDKSLANAVDQFEQKIKNLLDKLNGRFLDALQASNKVMVDRSKRAQNILKPGNRLQERSLPLLNFLLRYGADFADFLVQNVSIETDKHHILEYR